MFIDESEKTVMSPNIRGLSASLKKFNMNKKDITFYPFNILNNIIFSIYELKIKNKGYLVVLVFGIKTSSS